jgi:Ca2+-binding RTX toxin-like protein
MPRRSSALALASLLTGGLLTAAPAEAAGETCQGRPATIVGAGPDIQGTAGDDVIVTGRSRITDAGAGDDVVCVTPSSFLDPQVNAGAGNDVVDTTSSTTFMGLTLLGPGLDRYVGGSGGGAVRAEGADDVVLAGDGSVSVFLDIGSPVGSTVGRYEGGSDGYIDVRSESFDIEVVLDEQVVVAGTPAAAITGFSSAGVVAPRVILRGNAEDNDLDASGCDVQVRGAGGGDAIDGAHGALLGEPTFECQRVARLYGDLGDDVIRGSAGRDRIVGGAGDDSLESGPGADLVLGGSGADRLKGGGGPDALRGNAGSDTLTGKAGGDTLLGNAGRDSTNGNRHRDRCVAERELNCER